MEEELTQRQIELILGGCDEDWDDYIASILPYTGRQPALEPYILGRPMAACSYAKYVIRGPWPEAEPTILQDPWAAYFYTVDVIRSRWREAEPIIATHPWTAYNYASVILCGRWPEGESAIDKDPAARSWYDKFLAEINQGR